MKISILTKLIILLVFLAIGPIGLLGYLSINDFEQMGETSKEYIEKTGETAIENSEISLNTLGEEIIKNTALFIAKELEIYIRANPQMTVKDLQADQYFRSLAVQPVGKTGYTAITDVATLVCRFHASTSIVNLDLHLLAEKLPGFWSVMEKTQGGHVSQGYYDWAEEDGSIKQKYMYIAIVSVPTADNVTLSVAATTYIEEFSEPINEIRDNINLSISSIIEEVKNKTSYILLRNLIAISLLIVVIGIFGSAFAYSIVKPLREFKIIADKVSQGNLEDTNIEIKSGDELGELGESLKRMIVSMKYYMEKAKKIEE